jgi:tripartite-type tricarboxylate transporter receptor subunit TctC
MRPWIFAAALILAVCGARAAIAAPPDFTNKRIEITVGYGPGGGPDAIARVVARHLGRFLPGNPTLIVMNRPGAEGVLQANYMATLAPRDGLSIGYVSRAAALAQISSRPGVRYDMALLQWLGGLSQQNIIVFTRRGMGLDSIADLRQSKAPIMFAIRAPGGTDFLAGKALDALGVPIKLVAGYGSEQTTFAFEQGEIDATALTEGAFRQRGSWGGLAVPVVAFGPIRPDTIAFGPDLKPPRTKASIYSLINKALGLPVATFAGPAGLPSDITEAYRKAFSEMERDPYFLDDARSTDIEISPVTGSALQEIFTDFLQARPEAKDEFSNLVR